MLSCYEGHQNHDREKLENLNEDIIEGDLFLIEARKGFLEMIRNKTGKEINEINNCIKFYDLILKTKKKYENNGHYPKNIEIVRRDLDAQYEYRDKLKEIEDLKKFINEIKLNKLLNEFNKKYCTNISITDNIFNVHYLKYISHFFKIFN